MTDSVEWVEADIADHTFRLMVNSVVDYAIFLLNPVGVIQTWNQGAERIKGYRAEEIIGQHFSVFYLPEQVDEGHPQRELEVAQREGRWNEEGWRVRKDGTRFWASVVITALWDGDGTLTGFAKLTRDLTERKFAEEERTALLERERVARQETEATVRELQNLQSVTDAALAHLNLDDLFTALLRRVRDALGVDTVAVLLLDEERAELVARAALGLEEEVEAGVRIPVAAGFAGRVAAQRRPIYLEDISRADIVNPILLEKGLHSMLGVPLITEGRLLGVMHVGSLTFRRFAPPEWRFLEIAADRVALAIDRANLYAAAASARRDAQVAEMAVQVRDEFLSIAAHELRTPVTTLSLAVQLLERRLRTSGTASGPDLTATVTLVGRQTDKLSTLVNQLLETVRLESEALELVRTRTDLGALVARVVQEFELHATAHSYVVDAPAGIWADVDGARIEQVVVNLMENAVKFSLPGTTIDVSALTTPSGAVTIAVRDHGIGVPSQHRDHIFERFFQAHREEQRPGMGLGLYISREIVRLHGGSIEANLPPDGGTRVVVTLPVGA